MKSTYHSCDPYDTPCAECRSKMRAAERKMKLLGAYDLTQRIIKPGLKHVAEVCKELREELELMRVGLEGESS